MKTEFQNFLQSVINSESTSKEEWSDILGTQSSEIESWLDGSYIPSSVKLRMLYKVICENDFSNEALIKFNNIIDLPITHITDLWSLFGQAQTLREYMLMPLYETFTRHLHLVSPEKRENVLLAVINLCALEMDK